MKIMKRWKIIKNFSLVVKNKNELYIIYIKYIYNLCKELDL